MREILFRGKLKYGEGWIYGSYIKIGSLDSICEDTKLFKAIIPETLGQFTGLTDKNGTKIFEGDIVSVTDESAIPVEGERKYRVYFDQDRCGYFPFAHGDGCGCCETDTVYPDYYKIEVIGNIHDNPELIGGAEK